MKLPAALLALLAALAGCIAPPDQDVSPAAHGDADARAPAPPADRIDGMTAKASKTDRDVECATGTPTAAGVCAERELVVTGRIGEDRLPVDLKSTNGAITIVAGTGDAWSLHAVYRVQAASKDEARDALDTAWTWTHEENGQHVLKAGPTSGAVSGLHLPLLPPGPRVVMAKYEVVLPAWVVLDLRADTSNGPLTVTGITADGIHLDTSNGAIELTASAAKVVADTRNGAIDATIRPTADGSIELDTSNGAIDLALVEGPRHGYDLEADTSNGRITIHLKDGDARIDKTSGTFRTHDYDSRAVKTTVALDTSNGSITVAAG